MINDYSHWMANLESRGFPNYFLSLPLSLLSRLRRLTLCMMAGNVAAYSMVIRAEDLLRHLHPDHPNFLERKSKDLNLTSMS